MSEQSALPFELLEAAAGMDLKSAARWEELSRGMAGLFPRGGARTVAHARRAGLDPWNVNSVSFSSSGQPVLWFTADDAQPRHAATPVGVVFYGPPKG